MSLDPDDPRPPYLQVAASLRAAILTRKVGPGERLPSQAELSTHYGVARMTIQQALRILKDEGLTVSRQGSGVFVRERTAKPVSLRTHVEQAFESSDVRIDFAGFTAETLHGILIEPLDRVREGRITPDSISIRLLLPDLTQELSLPVLASGTPAESESVRARVTDIVARHAGAITAAIEELEDLELVRSASVETRVHGSPPLFKAYLINGTELFFGYYPVVKHDVKVDGKRRTIFDPMGKDATMVHFAADSDEDSKDSQFITQTQMWFDSVWNSIARESLS